MCVGPLCYQARWAIIAQKTYAHDGTQVALRDNSEFFFLSLICRNSNSLIGLWSLEPCRQGWKVIFNPTRVDPSLCDKSQPVFGFTKGPSSSNLNVYTPAAESTLATIGPIKGIEQYLALASPNRSY